MATKKLGKYYVLGKTPGGKWILGYYDDKDKPKNNNTTFKYVKLDKNDSNAPHFQDESDQGDE